MKELWRLRQEASQTPDSLGTAGCRVPGSRGMQSSSIRIISAAPSMRDSLSAHAVFMGSRTMADHSGHTHGTQGGADLTWHSASFPSLPHQAWPPWTTHSCPSSLHAGGNSSQDAGWWGRLLGDAGPELGFGNDTSVSPWVGAMLSSPRRHLHPQSQRRNLGAWA